VWGAQRDCDTSCRGPSLNYISNNSPTEDDGEERLILLDRELFDEFSCVNSDWSMAWSMRWVFTTDSEKILERIFFSDLDWWRTYTIKNLLLYQKNYCWGLRHVPFRCYRSFREPRKLSYLDENQTKILMSERNRSYWVDSWRLFDDGNPLSGTWMRFPNITASQQETSERRNFEIVRKMTLFDLWTENKHLRSTQ
jgi:hypothetical protein